MFLQHSKRPRQEEHEFEASRGYPVKCCPQNKTKQKTQNPPQKNPKTKIQKKKKTQQPKKKKKKKKKTHHKKGITAQANKSVGSQTPHLGHGDRKMKAEGTRAYIESPCLK